MATLMFKDLLILVVVTVGIIKVQSEKYHCQITAYLCFFTGNVIFICFQGFS